MEARRGKKTLLYLCWDTYVGVGSGIVRSVSGNNVGGMVGGWKTCKSSVGGMVLILIASKESHSIFNKKREAAQVLKKTKLL